MIVKNDKAESQGFLKPVIILLLTVGAGYGLWYSLPFINDLKTEGIIHCDAEIRRSGRFISNGNTFNNASTQSSEEAFTGKYSSRIGLGVGYQFGMGYDLENPEKGQNFVVSVWMKKELSRGKGYLVIKDDTETFNFNIEKSIQRKDGWELLEQEIEIPFDKEINVLKVYVMSDGKEEIFFDDLKIIEKGKLNPSTSETDFQLETINIQLKDKALQKLKQKRNEALEVGVLESADTDWVKGKLTSTKSDDQMSIQLRLKGDWLDHLKGDKWSFRVKVKDPFAWNRLKTFSLHTPEARDFLREWVLHQWWKSEDVLTPRYDFVEVKLNGKSLGIYAYEEHFDKQLPESQKRREGVIVRFSEEGFWANHARTISEFGDNPFRKPANIENKSLSDIKPFKEGRTVGSANLQKQFELAQSLLFQYQKNTNPPSEIFDLERMAKYYAIVDAMGAYHGTAWHNERFYFNSVTSRLEPIGFDGFPTYFSPRKFLGEGA